MRYISIIAVTLTLTLIASSAGAGLKIREWRGVWGIGTLTCGFWIEAKDARNEIVDWRAIAWVNGYLSGRSLSGAAKYKNVLGTRTVDAFWDEIEWRCREKPAFPFGGIVDAIVRDIEAHDQAAR